MSSKQGLSEALKSMSIRDDSTHPWHKYYKVDPPKKEPKGYKQLLSNCSLHQVQQFRNISKKVWLTAKRTTNPSKTNKTTFLTSDSFPSTPFAYYSVAYKTPTFIILTPVFNEVVADDRLDLRIVALNKSACDTINPGIIDFDDHPQRKKIIFLYTKNSLRKFKKKIGGVFHTQPLAASFCNIIACAHGFCVFSPFVFCFFPLCVQTLSVLRTVPHGNRKNNFFSLCHPIGDVLCVTKLQPKQTLANKKIDKLVMDDVKSVNGKQFWEVSEFYPMKNDIIENVVTTPYFENVSEKSKAPRKLMCVGSNMGNIFEISESVAPKVQVNDILLTSVFLPIIKPGQFLSSLEPEHWLTVAKMSPKLRNSNSYLPVVVKSKIASENVKRVFENYKEAFKVYPREAAYNALRIVVEHGSNGLRSIKDSKIDQHQYTTKIESYKMLDSFVNFTFKLIGASVTPPAVKWNRSVSIKIISPICAPFYAEVLGAQKHGVDLKVKARAPSNTFTENILRSLKNQEISVRQRREMKKNEIDWNVQKGSNADKFIQAIYGGPPLKIPKLPNIPRIKIGGLELLETQTRYAQLISNENVAAIIGSSSFGCGKTAAIASAALYALKNDEKSKNWQMLTAVTNSAVVALVEKLVQLDSNVQIVRIITPANMEQVPSTSLTQFDYPTVLCELLKEQLIKEDVNSMNYDYEIPEDLVKQMLAYLKKNAKSTSFLKSERLQRLVKNAKHHNESDLLNYFMDFKKPTIIVGTIQTILNSFNMSWRPFIGAISNIQIDEASTVPRETLLQLVTLFPNSRYSLVGDYRQLSPYFEQDASKLLIDTAIGETLRDCVEEDLLPSVFFNGVFRCPPEITEQLGKLFYNDSLKSFYRNCETVKELEKCSAWRLNCSNKFSTIFIDTIGSRQRYRGKSLRNYQEAEIAQNLAEHLSQFISREKIAILCFYRAQMLELQDWSENRGIHVGCVDSGQGKEWPVCIVLTTKTAKVQDNQFISNARRINVALSRSRHLNFILGNKKSLSGSDLWASIIGTCKKSNTLVASNVFNEIINSDTNSAEDLQDYDDNFEEEEVDDDFEIIEHE